MARDRDWVDYANVASNVIQNVQLSNISGKMQELPRSVPPNQPPEAV